MFNYLASLVRCTRRIAFPHFYTRNNPRNNGLKTRFNGALTGLPGEEGRQVFRLYAVCQPPVPKRRVAPPTYHPGVWHHEALTTYMHVDPSCFCVAGACVLFHPSVSLHCHCVFRSLWRCAPSGNMCSVASGKSLHRKSNRNAKTVINNDVHERKHGLDSPHRDRSRKSVGPAPSPSNGRTEPASTRGPEPPPPWRPGPDARSTRPAPVPAGKS